jgi:murein DD-endopeptidase MepM/ murein hydrolase activator NlpD
MLGLAVTMGITSLPTNCLNALAEADRAETSSITPSTPDLHTNPVASTAVDPYVAQLRSDIAVMKSHPGVLLAQAVPSGSYPRSVANLAEASNVRFSGEVPIEIDVPAPRTRSFKSVPTTQAYNPVPSGDEGYIDSTPATKTGVTAIGFAWPAAGTLTSRYGRRWGRMHKGIDISGPVGTPIYAAADGVAIAAGWSSGGYGNVVEIRHSNGTVTRYAHNSRLSVSVGQVVRQGQQIAAMGSTGQSTGSHLHFEIRPGGRSAVNPIAYLPSYS